MVNKKMLNLAFDTTAMGCAVALMDDNKVLRKSVKKMDFGQAESLMIEIQSILQNESVKMEDLDLITVCTGPGSFTGVRSSLAAARTFGLALPNVKLTGVSAFEAYIEDLDFDELAELNAVIIETKRSDFYFQLFDAKRKSLCEPMAAEYEDIIKMLRHKKVSIIGDGAERFLAKPSGLSLHVIKMEDMVSIEALARCGRKRMEKKNLDYPKPLYLRAPDVCLKN